VTWRLAFSASTILALNALRHEAGRDEYAGHISRSTRDTSLSKVAKNLDDLMSELRSGSRAGIVGTENLINLVVEASPSAMVLVDERGHISLVNAQTESLFGYTRNELLGQSIELLVPERFHRGHPELRASLQWGAARSGDGRRPRPSWPSERRQRGPRGDRAQPARDCRKDVHPCRDH
jgi:PAS domain-containing protein